MAELEKALGDPETRDGSDGAATSLFESLMECRKRCEVLCVDNESWEKLEASLEVFSKRVQYLGLEQAAEIMREQRALEASEGTGFKDEDAPERLLLALANDLQKEQHASSMAKAEAAWARSSGAWEELRGIRSWGPQEDDFLVEAKGRRSLLMGLDAASVRSCWERLVARLGEAGAREALRSRGVAALCENSDSGGKPLKYDATEDKLIKDAGRFLEIENFAEALEREEIRVVHLKDLLAEAKEAVEQLQASVAENTELFNKNQSLLTERLTKAEAKALSKKREMLLGKLNKKKPG